MKKKIIISERPLLNRSLQFLIPIILFLGFAYVNPIHFENRFLTNLIVVAIIYFLFFSVGFAYIVKVENKRLVSGYGYFGFIIIKVKEIYISEIIKLSLITTEKRPKILATIKGNSEFVLKTLAIDDDSDYELKRIKTKLS